MKPTLFIISLLLNGLLYELNAQWTIKNIDENSFSNSNIIKFKNDSLGLFMGDHSKILKTEDIGETWKEIELNINVNIKDFQYIEDSSIFALGDYYTGNGENLTSKLIKSEDLGETWDSIANFQGQHLYSLNFYNNDSGIVAGYDGIYRTINSGVSWSKVWSIIEFGYKYGEIIQLSFQAQIGYAIGIGRNQHNNPNFDYFLLRSKDAGLTWDTIKTFQYPPTTIYFMNQDTGFIGTESSSSIILKTTDGGNTWNETQGAKYYNSVNSIHFTSNMIGFAAGAPFAFIPEGPTSFFISKTINGGVTWESYDSIGMPINSIYFINDTIGFVSGSYNLIMKSSGKINGLPEDYPWHLVGGSLDIDETKSTNCQIKIYPNPTNGLLWVEQTTFSHPIKAIKLISATGRIIEVIKPLSDKGNVQIDMTNFDPGIYFMQVMYLDSQEIIKILKK